jgi:hypothetical protein
LQSRRDMSNFVSSGAALFSFSMAVTSLLNQLKEYKCDPSLTPEGQKDAEPARIPSSTTKSYKASTSNIKRDHILPPDFHVAIIGGGEQLFCTACIRWCKSDHCLIGVVGFLMYQALAVWRRHSLCSEKALSAQCTSEIGCSKIASRASA